MLPFVRILKYHSYRNETNRISLMEVSNITVDMTLIGLGVR